MKKYISLYLGMLMIFAFSVLTAFHAHRADAYERQLTDIYQSAMLSALSQMEDVSSVLQKALLSGHAMRPAYLSTAAEEAGQVQRSLSLLPLSHPDTMKAIKLSNQLADYAQTLMSEEQLTDEDVRQLGLMIDACQSYTAMLQEKEETLTHSFPENAAFYPEEESPPLDEKIAYPTLIYDGPFSDALREEALPLSGEKEIGWEEAARIAKSFVGEDRVQKVSQGTDTYGPNPCHGVTLLLQDITLDAAVTKQGGKVLWITCRQGAFPSETTVEACREEALRFLAQRGYENMENTGFQVYEGVAVLSFAPRENHVLLYPDLIKVQLRMDTAKVIGIETKDYLQNHKSRGLPHPDITETKARESVSPLMQITDSQLCLIPKETTEILCYEFRCAYQEQEYLVYIRADTGAQADLLRIVETNVGPETV